MNKQIQSVTDRIIERSQKSRARYLAAIEKAKSKTVHRSARDGRLKNSKCLLYCPRGRVIRCSQYYDHETEYLILTVQGLKSAGTPDRESTV